MVFGSLLRRVSIKSTIAASVAVFCGLCLHAQTSMRTVNPSPADYAAAAEATNVKHHAWPANTEAAKTIKGMGLSNAHGDSAAQAVDTAAPDSGGPRYPADLQYHGGPVAVSMKNHLIFLHPNGGCTIAGCWGDPGRFLRDLFQSEFIHVVDQYTGSTANDRYTVAGKVTNINYTPPSEPFTDADMQAIVHAVVVSRENDDDGFATGYGNEYHVFLPPGQDECFDSTFTVCYSPDKPSTWFFCAYHGSTDFKDIGHVLYSVEPFAGVMGCSSRPGTPNGQLADSTNNVLSHETFETITDPDGTAWWNSVNNGLFGAEIGDECGFVIFFGNPNPPPPLLVFFDPSNVTLNGKPYAAQPEYNNAAHACTTTP